MIKQITLEKYLIKHEDIIIFWEGLVQFYVVNYISKLNKQLKKWIRENYN